MFLFILAIQWLLSLEVCSDEINMKIWMGFVCPNESAIVLVSAALPSMSVLDVLSR